MENKNIATTNIECLNTHQTLILVGFLAESQKQYDIEKNAKNEAYSFIIQMGLLDQFKEFSRHYKDIDHYAACIDMLTEVF